MERLVSLQRESKDLKTKMEALAAQIEEGSLVTYKRRVIRAIDAQSVADAPQEEQENADLPILVRTKTPFQIMFYRIMTHNHSIVPEAMNLLDTFQPKKSMTIDTAVNEADEISKSIIYFFNIFRPPDIAELLHSGQQFKLVQNLMSHSETYRVQISLVASHPPGTYFDRVIKFLRSSIANLRTAGQTENFTMNSAAAVSRQTTESYTVQAKATSEADQKKEELYRDYIQNIEKKTSQDTSFALKGSVPSGTNTETEENESHKRSRSDSDQNSHDRDSRSRSTDRERSKLREKDIQQIEENYANRETRRQV